jgi:hypothetical protein
MNQLNLLNALQFNNYLIVYDDIQAISEVERPALVE